MADSDQNSQIVNNADPNQPVPPGNGDGGGDGGGNPPAIVVTSISPIAGALAGGSAVTVTGSGFQSGAEVFFGTTAATNVDVQSSTQLLANAPAGTQTGTVPISVVNPDGSHGELANGFTYFTGDPSNVAEVLGVEPPNIIEDTDSQVTIRGRNLIAAHENGLLALRGPARAAISISDFSSSRDETTGIETLACTVRVVGTPPLAAAERMAIQVLASVRPGAQTDGIAESSKEMFVVLPKTMPVTLAYTKSVDPTRPNLVIVTGRNLEGCSLDLGANATIHAQKSEDDYVAALVSYPNDQTAPELAVRADDGGEVARLEVSMPTAGDAQATAPTKESAQADLAIEPGGDPGDGGGDGIPGLTPVPGQQVVGPTAESSTVVNLGGQTLGSFSFDWSSFAVSLFRITFRLRIANFIKVVSFFDGGGEELNSPVLAKVGHLMPLRGLGILVALRVEIIVSIRLLIIISWKHGFDFSPWGSDPGFGLGSLVIGFELDIDIDIEIFFMVALVLPNGNLKVLALEDFDLNFHFQLDANGHQLTFNRRKHEVRPRRIGPLLGLPFLCEDRFQLADDNGQTSFTDASGGTLAFYFVRGPGRCCLRWNFDLDLIQISDDGSERSIQAPFDADFCLNALDSSNQNIPIVVSDQCPRGSQGFPGVEQLTIGDPDKDEDHVRALMRPVDAATGDFLPADELEDVTEAGYAAYFYLKNSDDEVLESHALFGDGKTGLAVATETGENRICVQLSDVPINIIQIGEAPSFWPGAVTGFSILSFLARGLAPALLFECESSVGLPVRVKSLALPGTMTVELSLAYYDQNDLKPVPKQGAGLLLDRNEPFETQREYVLAATVSANQVQFPQTIKITSKNPQVGNMLAGTGFGNPREAAHAAGDFFEGELANSSSSGSSLSFTVTSDMVGKLIAVGEQDPNKPHLKVKPRNKEEAGKFVPPGTAVTKNDRTLKIDFEAKVEGNSTAQVQLASSSLTLLVSNDETFEEYLRVFQEVTDILNGPGSDGFFKGFDAAFYNELKTKGATAAVLNEQGKKLWDHAWQNVGTLKDDRPLYWARLRAIAALRAFAKRQKPAITGNTLDQLITQFEWPSRGLAADGTLDLEASLMGSKVFVATGFDPFQLPTVPDRSNPSGLVALHFQHETVGTKAVPVRTAIIPVRYRDFDAGLIEKIFTTRLSSIFMLITCSENGDENYYDIERWACRNRVIFTDNEKKSPQQLPVAPDHEFEQSTLPYELVIASAEMLTGPKGDAPFVIDQSYRIAGESKDPSGNRTPPVKPANQREQANPGRFRPEPLLDDMDHAAFSKVADVPSGTSDMGSGGSYLSNEIFYRVCRLRNDFAPSLKSGHFHVPGTETDPRGTGPALITGVAEAFRRFVDALVAVQPKITSFHPTSVRPGGTVTVVGENFEGTTDVLVGSDSVQFHVRSSSEIDIDIFDDVSSGFISVITPFGTAVSSTRLIVIRRIEPDDLGPQLLAKRTELGLTPKAAAQGIGVSAGTYRRWEQGKDRPSARYHAAIVTFLGHDPGRDPKEFGERIRTARQKDGLTRAQLAAQLGVAASTVKTWENGTVNRPNARVEAIFEDYLNQS
jgi:transcriptional regulator with XRE-family HTH domain/pyrrolidone-carboxylate peptidase